MQKAANQRSEFLQKIGKSVAASASGLTIWKKKKKRAIKNFHSITGWLSPEIKDTL